MTTIRGTREIAKGNIEGNYEHFPKDLHAYLQLGLIKHSDVVMYMTLLAYHNTEMGYAYPTNVQLEITTGLSKGTVVTSLKRLEKAGLMQKKRAKYFTNKNIFYVLKPLTRDELYQQLPEEAEAYEKERAKKLEEAEQHKAEFLAYKEMQKQSFQII
ncbi:TPA: helix-turn-helix domain-containing protein [Bacillus toyonensis]|uniref:helix-turn-helix domain-containing protein n=1 Tax=Bacillus paranthracis TaxID=2026186 RepID=UPI00330FB995|nr:helix-turn-helix domain-containing protein [Bacillus toyonensis]